jgi:hypothetical protein
MTPDVPVRLTLCALVLLWVSSTAAAAQPVTPAESPEPGTTRAEIQRALQEVQRKYGADAVLLQGSLMGNAIRNGSLLETTIAVDGFEEQAGKVLLNFTLGTGIVYDDRVSTAEDRAADIWTGVVVTTLRDFRRLNLSADAVGFRIGYTHRPYPPETADLRTELRDDPGVVETLSCSVLLDDVAAFGAGALTPQELADRATVRVNDSPQRLKLPATPAPTP